MRFVTTRVVTNSFVTRMNCVMCGAKCMQHNTVLSPAVRTTHALACAEGNYKEYEADLHRRKGIDADQPKRIKYKALVRA